VLEELGWGCGVYIFGGLSLALGHAAYDTCGAVEFVFGVSNPSALTARMSGHRMLGAHGQGVFWFGVLIGDKRRVCRVLRCFRPPQPTPDHQRPPPCANILSAKNTIA